MVKIAPSILSSDFSQLGQEIVFLESSSAEYIHLDIMDGHFVPNLTIGPDVVASLRPYSSKVFDVHLMLTHPDKYIEAFAKAGSDIIAIHVESNCPIIETLIQIRALNKKAGLVYKPDTPIEGIEQYFPYVDRILIMSVYPGFGGQKFMPESLMRGKEVSKKIKASSYSIDLEIDGGVNLSNYKAIIETGYNVLVAGNSIYKSEDKEKTIKTLRGN